MGRSTETDVVPFVAHYVFDFDGTEDNERCRLVDTECWAEEYGPEEWLEKPGEMPMTIREWVKGEDVNVGQGSWCYGTEWTKGDLRVVLLNESEYSHVGPHETAVVADERPSLEAFLKDFDDLIESAFGRKIHENDAIKQTG